MDMKVVQHRPAFVAAMVGAGVVAGSTIAMLVRSWYGCRKRSRVPITILSGFLGAGKVCNGFCSDKVLFCNLLNFNRSLFVENLHSWTGFCEPLYFRAT